VHDVDLSSRHARFRHLRPVPGPDDGGVARRRVAVVDDHALLAETLAEVLGMLGHQATAVPVDTVRSIIERIRAQQPAVALVDYHLGSLGTSEELIAALTDDGVRVIVLTADGARVTAARCIHAGALAVLGKGTSTDTLVEAIAGAAADLPLLDDSTRYELAAELRSEERRRTNRLAPFERLTPREREVLAMMCDGLNAAEMAEASYVSLATVRSQIRAVLLKLGVGTQLAAVAAAHRAGWVGRPASDSSTLAMTAAR
jgi:DNA-binding NarL/FixJ family response regulator